MTLMSIAFTLAYTHLVRSSPLPPRAGCHADPALVFLSTGSLRCYGWSEVLLPLASYAPPRRSPVLTWLMPLVVGHVAILCVFLTQVRTLDPGPETPDLRP
eukprot:855820-Rhodomonas_salina.2